MNNFQHEHGPHECICPESGYTTIVDEGIPCNTLRCPGSDLPMRATQTGEYRGLYHSPTTRVGVPVAQNEHGGLKTGLVIALGLGVLAVIGTVVAQRKKA